MVILREKFGSFNRVERVFAYDPDEGNALCLFRDYGGKPYLAASPLGDLEAIHDDPAGTFADVNEELRRRAEYVLPD